MAAAGNIVTKSADGFKSNVASLTSSTGILEGTVKSLLNNAADISSRLPLMSQSVIEVLANIRSIGERLDSLYERQEVIAQELGVLADNPLAAAQSARRAAEMASATEAALRDTVAALPKQMDKLRGAIIAALDREIGERQEAAGALREASESARQMALSAEQVSRQQIEMGTRVVSGFEQALEAAFARLSRSSLAAADTLTQAVNLLRDSPRHVLPDLNETSRRLTDNLDSSRRLVDALSSLRDDDGRMPRGGLWNWLRSRSRSH